MDADRSINDGWLALAGVGVGYVIAVGVVFVLVFAVPYLVLVA
ncbi:hypothetical protein [Halorubrum laminariae]|uniref:Uncharacterized protein n=1 Tax=Halorubrum laminariae TaxID=1433523 RepID=A0ABD6C168_9EURY|nr:hypothetical protein [Halorubrum laminariae]